jgi:hypothetical protein
MPVLGELNFGVHMSQESTVTVIVTVTVRYD